MKLRLPRFKRRDKRTPLEKEIDSYVGTMSSKRDDQEEYRRMCYNVGTLSEAAAKQRREPRTFELLLAAIPVFGTGLICITNWFITKRVTTFEETDVITTKAPQLKMPWR